MHLAEFMTVFGLRLREAFFSLNLRQYNGQAAGADVGRDQSLGTQIAWESERCKMPPAKSIPDWRTSREIGTIRGVGISTFDLDHRTNQNYYRQLANYEFARRLFRPVRLVVRNAGKVAAKSVRAELTIPAGAVILVVYPSDLPERPKRDSNIFPHISALDHIQPALRPSPGDGMRLSLSHIADDEWRAVFIGENALLAPRGFGVAPTPWGTLVRALKTPRNERSCGPGPQRS
jgi:hypothetical protein